MSIGSPAGAGHRKSSLLTVITAASILCVALGTHGADKSKPPVRTSPAAAAKPQKPVAEEKTESAAEEKPKTVGVVGIAVTFVAKGVVPPKKVEAAAVAGAKAAEVKGDEAATEEEEPKEETKKPKKKKSTKAAAKANAVAKSKAGGFGGFGGAKSNSFGGGSFGSGMFGGGAGGFASAGGGAFSGLGGLPYAAGGLMNFSPVMSVASANATAVAVASGDGTQASASASAGAFAAGGTLATTEDANCPKDTTTDSGEETTDDDAGLGNLPAELASVIKLTNQERTRAGLGTLTANDTLMTLAQEQSDRMANANTMSHEVNGLTFMQRITSSSYNPAYAGENIAFGQTTPEEVVTAWMNSPGHRANILNPNFTEIGVGVAQGSNGALYWTQIFGTPLGGSTQSSGSQTNSGTTDTTGTTQSTDSGTTTSNAAQSTGKQATGN